MVLPIRKVPPIRPSVPAPPRYLVTVDRDCRDVFLVDSEKGECEVVVELEQRLPADVERALSSDAQAWNRGLKTIRRVPDGFVVCDIFGIYRLAPDFSIRSYLSSPRFADIHSAIPCADGSILVSNTGVDEILRVTPDDSIRTEIDLHRWFPATPWMEHDLAAVEDRMAGDLRRLPLDWARESCHANWAEETPIGVVVSCFIQGEILFFRDGAPALRVPARPKIHAPRYLPDTRTILFSSSEESRIVEVDLTGAEVWSMEGFEFAKFADRLPGGDILVADTGGRRICRVNREVREVVWECRVPGTPYDVQPWVAFEDEA